MKYFMITEICMDSQKKKSKNQSINDIFKPYLFPFLFCFCKTKFICLEYHLISFNNILWLIQCRFYSKFSAL